MGGVFGFILQPAPPIPQNCPGSFDPRGRLSLQGGGSERIPALRCRGEDDSPAPPPQLSRSRRAPCLPVRLCVCVSLSQEGDARSSRAPPALCEPSGFGQLWQSPPGSHGDPGPDFRAGEAGGCPRLLFPGQRWRPTRQQRPKWGGCRNTPVCPCLQGQGRGVSAICSF